MTPPPLFFSLSSRPTNLGFQWKVWLREIIHPILYNVWLVKSRYHTFWVYYYEDLSSLHFMLYSIAHSSSMEPFNGRDMHSRRRIQWRSCTMPAWRHSNAQPRSPLEVLSQWQFSLKVKNKLSWEKFRCIVHDGRTWCSCLDRNNYMWIAQL